MKGERIHSAGPSITDRELELIAEAARDGWFDNYRTLIERFENAFADYLGVTLTPQ